MPALFANSTTPCAACAHSNAIAPRGLEVCHRGEMVGAHGHVGELVGRAMRESWGDGEEVWARGVFEGEDGEEHEKEARMRRSIVAPTYVSIEQRHCGVVCRLRSGVRVDLRKKQTLAIRRRLTLVRPKSTSVTFTRSHFVLFVA